MGSFDSTSPYSVIVTPVSIPKYSNFAMMFLPALTTRAVNREGGVAGCQVPSSAGRGSPGRVGPIGPPGSNIISPQRRSWSFNSSNALGALEAGKVDVPVAPYDREA